MKKTKTKRGFKKYTFKDKNNVECSIQESSIDGCIYLGTNSIGLNVGYPWKEITDDEIKEKFNGTVMVTNNRMHLNIKQVKKLLPLLINYIETGEL